MKNGFIKKATCLCVALFAPFLMGAKRKNDGLKDIVRPYLGTYDAEEVVFNGEDWLDKFSLLRAELKKEDFILYSRMKGGKVRTDTASYTFDEESGEITLTIKDSNLLKKGKFTLKKGKLRVVSRIGDKLLYISFGRK